MIPPGNTGGICVPASEMIAASVHYGEHVITTQPRCPHCRGFVYLDALICPRCEGELGYHVLTRQFHGIRHGRVVIDGTQWYACSNREWACNWLVSEDAPAGRCLSCRLTRRRPESDDTVALDKLARTEEAKRRLLLQLSDLGLPIAPWHAKDGGLGFDLLSSLTDGRPVTNPWEDFAETFAHYLHITGTL